MSRKHNNSFLTEAAINPKSAKRGKKRSRARADRDDGTCKEVARREECKKSEPGTSLLDDSAYISYYKHPLTPFGSVPPPSLLDSGKGQSVESSSYAINPLGSSSDLSELECMDLSCHQYCSTPKVSARREQILYYQQNYIFFKEHLEPLNKIVDEIISRGCKVSCFSENIREAPSRELRADILLKYAAMHLSRQEFESILKVSDYRYLIDNPKKGRALESSILEDEDEINLLSNNSFKELLKRELEPRCLIDRLLVDGVLSFHDHEDILVTSSRRKRVENLFECLENCSKRELQFFFALLKENDTYLLDEFKESQAAAS